MRFFNGDPNMPILEETYEPPLARLSAEQHRELRKKETRRKPFRELESRAARMLGELTLDELHAAALEILDEAEKLAGHDWQSSSIVVLSRLEDHRGVVSVDVYDSAGPVVDAKDRIVLASYDQPGVGFVIPADSAAWPPIIEQIARILRVEIDKVAAGAPIIDISSRRRTS